ncbi:unnamed protein product [Schistocephalus solidus]|uniref:V-ATPase_H_C domain-containing protein n=1 Tax=Schistocephalus solidus TaxID=70667 RepID=A0A183TR81_SCHSO|nr:unnamed protein product [Schistocephalus solidus]
MISGWDLDLESIVTCSLVDCSSIMRTSRSNRLPSLSLTPFQETLKTSVQDVSSLEEYTTELTSGRLEWSPVHKSEKFWRENADKFTEKNYELLKMLVYIMENSTEPLILAVAAYDVGEFVRHYPRGRQVIDQLGGKHLVMSLLQHADASVRYNALLALQKIMVHNW